MGKPVSVASNVEFAGTILPAAVSVTLPNLPPSTAKIEPSKPIGEAGEDTLSFKKQMTLHSVAS